MKSGAIVRATLGVSGVVIAAAPAEAAPVQWTLAGGGNGNYYERVEATGLTFDQAKAAAAALNFNGLPGRLVVFETPNYAAEFNFVDNNVYAPGVASNRIYWVGASRPASPNSALQDWSWVDGQPVPTSVTSTWNIDQFEGPAATTPYGAGFFIPSSHQVWDYITSNSSGAVSGYVVEYQAPEPNVALGGAVVLAVLSNRGGRRRPASPN